MHREFSRNQTILLHKISTLHDRIRWDEADGLTNADRLAQRLEGWSGSDIKVFAKEVAMHPLRRALRLLEAATPSKDGVGGSVPELGAFADADPPRKIELDPIVVSDIEKSLESVHPAPLTCALDKYNEWDRAFGSST